MENLVIEGVIVQKLDPQEGVSARGQWRKQEFVIETADQFPKRVCISCWKDKIDDLAKHDIHDKVRVAINIESREYNQRWYTEVKAWKIEGMTGQSSTAGEEKSATKAPDDVLGVSFSEEDDELPF